MALEILQGLMGEDTAMGALGEDTMEGGLGGGTGITPPPGYQIPVNRQPAQGGLAGAVPTDSLSTAREGYLKATQEMIDSLQQRISGQGYDISRLLFAFGQPTATGSIGSALANVGAEASRQRGEQEKMMPSMMKMRTELAANRLALAQQEEAERAMRGLYGAPGANLQAGPGAGLSQEAAVGTRTGSVGTGGYAAQGDQSFLTMPMDQIARMFEGTGPAGQEKLKQIIDMRKNYLEQFKSDGSGGIVNVISGQRFENPNTASEPIKREGFFGGVSGEFTLPRSQWPIYDTAIQKGDINTAAKVFAPYYPDIARRILGSGQQAAAPQASEQIAPQPAPQAPLQVAPPAASQDQGYVSPQEREQRRALEAEQAKQDIGMLSDEIKEARSPILTRYDKAPAVLQEAKQMTSLASTYPYAISIFNKPGMGPAIAQVLKEGLSVAPGISIQLGGFEDAVRRVVKADPDMVARVAREQNMSTDQAQRYLQQQGLDAVSLLLQSERRLDNLLNKAERKGEGSVSNFERVYFAQALPSLSNDPVKAYLLKTLALQEMAKFDQKVGELLMRRSESKQYDPRKMYQSDEYKALRNNYINSLEGITREFFPEFANKQFRQIRKETGV